MDSSLTIDSDVNFHEYSNLFPVMSGEEYEGLKKDIAENGLYNPITLYKDKIIDGRTRWRVCKELKIEPAFEVLGDDIDPLAYVVSQNLHRRHLNASQRAMIAARLATMRQGERTDIQPSANWPKVVSQEQAAQKLSIGERSLRRAKAVIDKGTDELVKAVNAGNVAVSLAARVSELAKEKQEQFIAVLEAGKKPREAYRQATRNSIADRPITPGKYRVIYADPPWQYSDSGIINDDNYGKAERHYDTIPLQKICNMPIENIAERDAVLFLWATSPMLEDAFKVIGAWGFRYKTSFVWDKVKHNYGHYNSVRHEFLLVATRGSCLPEESELFDSVQVIERGKKHSEKPERFRDIIDILYPSGSRIELFARKAAGGWQSWGNEF